MLSFYLSLVSDNGDQQEFMRIFEKYKQRMFAYIVRILNGDYHLSEDALQIAFTGIAKNIKKISSMNEETLEAYIFIVAKNSAFRVAKDNQKFNTIFDMYYNQIPFSSEDVQENIINKDSLNQVISFIKEMNPKYRDVLTLYYINHFSTKEISDILKRPIETIRTQLKRGTKMLKNKFKELNIWLKNRLAY